MRLFDLARADIEHWHRYFNYAWLQEFLITRVSTTVTDAPIWSGSLCAAAMLDFKTSHTKTKGDLIMMMMHKVIIKEKVLL